MNLFRQIFGDIGESGFHLFSSDGYKILGTGIMRMPGIAFTVGKQCYSIFREHLFNQVIGICGICQNLTFFRLIDRKFPEPIQVMFASSSESKFHGNTTGSNYHMDFEAIEPATFGYATSSVLFSSDNQGVRDTDIMANTYRKTVDAINGLKVQLFYGLSRVKEQFAKEFPDLMHPPIETAFTKNSRHQAGTSDKAKGLFNIPRKVLGSQQDDCDNFCVGRFTTLRLFMIHRFQYIVKKYIYCNGFINHGQSFFVC